MISRILAILCLPLCLHSWAYGATAHADLSSKSGSKVSGTVDFVDTDDGLKVSYRVQGLKPNMVNGFHIHEKGDCSAPDGKSAGGHYIEIAPAGGTSKEFPQEYAGDLKQIVADANGVALGSFYVHHLTVDGLNPVEHRAVIVHGGPDDPTKKSSPRVACGVIVIQSTD